MFDRFYLFILFKFFSSKNIFFDIEFLKLKKKLKFSKTFINFFFFFKKNIEKSIYLFKNNKINYISYFGIMKYSALDDQPHLFKKINKNSILNLKINSFKDNFEIKNFYYLYINICNNYGLYLKNNFSSYNIFYYNIFLKKKKQFILNFLIFKKNFFKIIKFIVNSSYLNLSPLLILNDRLNIHENFFNLYLKFLNTNYKHNYIFIIDPFIKIKHLSKLKKMNLPIFCIADDTVNIDWIDYPIFLKKLDLFNIHIFFYFYLNCFFLGQDIKKKYYKNLYKNYLNLNFIKENIFKNELN